MGKGCSIGLKKCIGVLADSSIMVVGKYTMLCGAIQRFRV